MTQETSTTMREEDKKLLLVDLCARLPYGVICEDMEGKTRPLFGITPSQHFLVTLDNATDGTNGLKFCTIDCVKPYLRPLSSMTEEEYRELKELSPYYGFAPYKFIYDWCPNYDMVDWLNAHHFDFRNLIESGLAIDCTGLNIY